MTGEELLGPRTIVECVESVDGGWDVILSCGHAAVFVIQPVSMEIPGCAQCVEELLEKKGGAA